MIIILLVPIVFTAVFSVLRRNMREGIVGDKEDVSDKPTDDPKDTEGEAFTPSTACNADTSDECGKITGCSWNEKTKQCASMSGMTTLHPKWVKDEEKTKQDFYKTLPEDVDDLGIHEMTKRTEDLSKKQKELRESMTKMAPMMDQAHKILANIDVESMKSMMNMAETMTTPFQKKAS